MDCRRTGLLLLVAAATATASEPSATEDAIGSVQVFLTPDEARARAFPQAVRFDTLTIQLPTHTQGRLLDRGLGAFADDSVAVYIARDSAAAPVGYAIIGEEIGKYRPITFLVAVDLHLQVSSVAILVYRESRGGEVRRQRFLRQYRGKDGTDPIRINRDIINITGATLSVRALNKGVRKSLLLLEAMLDRPIAVTASPEP
jgi:hypothetical protein